MTSLKLRIAHLEWTRYFKNQTFMHRLCITCAKLEMNVTSEYICLFVCQLAVRMRVTTTEHVSCSRMVGSVVVEMDGRAVPAPSPWRWNVKTAWTTIVVSSHSHWTLSAYLNLREKKYIEYQIYENNSWTDIFQKFYFCTIIYEVYITIYTYCIQLMYIPCKVHPPHNV